MAREYYIPENINTGKKFFGIKNRNLIEAAVIETVLYKSLSLLPLFITYKAVVMIIPMAGLGILAVVGIRDESLTEFLYSTIRFYKKRMKMHFASPSQFEERTEDDDAFNKDVLVEYINKAKDYVINGKTNKVGEDENEADIEEE